METELEELNRKTASTDAHALLQVRLMLRSLEDLKLTGERIVQVPKTISPVMLATWQAS